VGSHIETYRVKAKQFARLAVVVKSLREGRRHRKLAEMYWALALGEEPAGAHVPKMSVNPKTGNATPSSP
jgi:hypothetical protein